ncbi:MAG: response regulator [Clostridia bacterium]|nr:response regulator [Deltaproteobacteria bacterium]
MAVVLVADDDDATREVMAELCCTLGLRVLQAVNGEEALASIKANKPDVVLLDLEMPKLDGLAVLESLRAHAVAPAPGVIIVTANTDATGKMRGTELGAIDFVDKPFRVAELRKRIERVVSIVRLERHLHSAENVLAQMRAHDPVTGAGSFGMLSSALEACFTCARVTGKDLSCVVVSDELFPQLLNGEKRSNADTRLRKIASSIEKVLRGADMLFRVDHAEFVMLLPGTPEVGARRVIERVGEALSQNGLEDGVSLAVAAATYPHPEIEQASTLYRAVNVSLAQARSRVERRVAFFEGF